MQVDIFVVRDASTGVPAMIARSVAPHVSVLNAGESEVSHPTQGLLDLMTILLHKGDVSRLRVAIIGDIKHSRVASSAYQALSKFEVGELRLVGPAELLPDDDTFPGAVRDTSLDERHRRRRCRHGAAAPEGAFRPAQRHSRSRRSISAVTGLRRSGSSSPSRTRS